MYFPFLYGRRAELLAIRAMLNDPRDRTALCPIIEPVKSDIGDLRRYLESCEKKNQPTLVVINPTQGELAGGRRAWLQDAATVLAACPSAVPAYQTSNQTTLAQITAALNRFPDRDVAVIHNGAVLPGPDLRQLAQDPLIAWHVVFDGRLPAQQSRALPGAKKVLLRDGFRRLARNADYNGTEFFSDQYKTFPPAAGFGDCVCLGSLFQEGGGPPGAVAIHAGFKDPDSGDIWIEHFLSDDQDVKDRDVAKKFSQAATHLVRAVRRRRREFGTNQALDAYAICVQQHSYPGLTKNKELQIVHHMCLVLDVLSGAL